VDKEGPQTEQIQAKPSGSNVVRLPRDWLGPRDELVPFGPSAPNPDSGLIDGKTIGIDRPRLRPLPDELVLPPSAADFWGERADAVQDVLQGPAPTPAGARVEFGPTLPTVAAERPSRRRLRWPHMGRLVAAGSVCALAGVVAVATHFATQSPSTPGVAGATSASTDTGRPLAGIGRPPTIPAVLAVRRPHRTTDHHPSAHSRRSHLRRASKLRGPSPTQGTPVRYSPSPSGSSSAPASSGGSGSSGAAGSSAGTEAASGASGAGSGSSGSGAAASNGSGSGTSQASGPTGAGAPFGPGHLG
jgi:hypothetical protein